jgi:hypothetical protein
MRRGLPILLVGLFLLSLGIGLARVRPAARSIPPTQPARLILITRTPQPGGTPTPSLLLTPTPEGRWMRVAGTGGLGLRLREGPGLNHPTVAVLPEGTRLWVFPESREADGLRWYRGRTEEGGLEGWVAEPYLAPEPPSSP